MKKILLLILLLFSLLVRARNLQEAYQEASSFFSSPSPTLRMPADPNRLSHVWTAVRTDGTPAFYVFNRGEKDGFAIISADDRTHVILAYSESGYFDADNLPDNAQMWLRRYLETIDAIPADYSSQYTAQDKTYTPVTPICTTQWGQYEPYNQLCPMERGKRCVTGCNVTAAAQIMKVHQYPATGTGSHSYYWHDRDGDSTLLSVDFENTTYAWNLMLDNYWATSSTSAQQAAVATLMYHCGVASEIKYTADGSGTSSEKMCKAMIDHFGYDKGICVLLFDYMSEDAFIDSLAGELQAGRPVLMAGHTLEDTGHAFVCDGMDADGLLHINWGWDGMSDAYFRVSALKPEQQGAGGSVGNYAFIQGICAFTHIQPDNNNHPCYTLTADEIGFDELRIKRTRELRMHVDRFFNRSLYKWAGQLEVMLYKDNQLYDTYPYWSSLALPPLYGYTRLEKSFSFQSLPIGEYELVLAHTMDESANSSKPIFVKGIGEYRCRMVVTSDSISLSLPQANNDNPDLQALEPVFIDNSELQYPKTRTTKLFRNGQLLILRGEKVYTITGQEVK